MKTYRIAMPPRHAGVYMLKNAKTKSYYVGQSVSLYRRFCEWRSALQGGYGIRSASIFGAVSSSDLEDWEFCIVRELPGATENELNGAESSVIHNLKARGVLLLNHQPVLQTQLPVSGRGLLPITYEGRIVTHKQAAEILGCSVKTIGKRAARYRARGETIIRLEDWGEVSKKYRPQKNQF